MKYLIAIIMILAGFSMVWKTEWLVSNFGHVYFFEKYFGAEGGTRLGYKLIGMLVIFMGFLIISGMMEGFIGWLFGPLLRVTNIS
jgi:1,4-dihydroxy-2-naphthoate octaprenyltransferase